MELRYKEGPSNWQNMFVKTRFVNLYRDSFSYCFIFYYYWSKKKLLDRGLPYRGSTVTYIFIYLNSIFVGIRIVQHLNLLLVRIDPPVRCVVSLKTPIFTKPHLVLDFCVFKPARLCSICNDAEVFFDEGSRLNLKTTPRSNYGFLKRIISADDVVPGAFR